eukprot:4821173-Prymnesium_polylepis.1
MVSVAASANHFLAMPAARARRAGEDACFTVNVCVRRTGHTRVGATQQQKKKKKSRVRGPRA